MRVTLVTLGTTVSTVAVVANAFFQKKQFYPSVVYLTKSNPSMAVMYAQVFVLVFLFGKAFRRIFFGQLRAAELEHLIERFWFVITETCLAFTVFRDDFSPRFVALFTFLLFMKAFHWLVEDRVDYMERSPVITLKFHIRVLSLLFILGTVDSMLIHHALKTTLASGASVQMVFGFEYAILLIMVVAIFMKYILHSIDMRTENPWESKTVYLLYNELVTGFIKCVLYIAFVAVMVKIHTLPLFAIRPMYLSIKSFKKSLSDVILSRRAIAYMNTRFPDASPEELSQLDNTCIICREEMLVGKKLPCNHIFHVHCLRSWFQRQQSCPTCRMDVLVEQPPQPARPARPVEPAVSPPPVSSQQPPVGPFHPPPSFGAIPPFVPFPPGTSAQPHSSFSQPSTGPSFVPPMDFPLFYGAHSFDAVNPPPPPFPLMNPLSFVGPLMFPNLNLNALSDDELRAMEGQERANVQARVLLLKNIHSLLDAAVLQLNQYACVISDLHNIANVNDRSSGTARASDPPSSGAAPTYPCENESKKTDGSGSGSSVQVPCTVNPLNEGRDAVEEVPSVDVDSNSEKADEIRRRRLERFESTNANSNS